MNQNTYAQDDSGQPAETVETARQSPRVVPPKEDYTDDQHGGCAAAGGETPDAPHVVEKDRSNAADEVGEPCGKQASAGSNKYAYVQELEEKLAEKDARLNATLSQYKEARDEFEAAKARLRRDITREIEAGKRSMLVDLLDIVDNLDRAINAAGPTSSAGAAKADALLTGVTMVRDQFMSKLSTLGVQRIRSLDEMFDPERHEAVSTVPVDDPAKDGTVIGVVREGYIINDQTLRYAMVAVGKCEAPAVDTANSETAVP